ncbi:hypothetical protein [Thiomicrospira microaerophila]|uniref:hypothetical protein n=1 Tax=Thiomicrospira microaerophila TaxID=406020 RepID=UPI0005C9EB4F|nr:hypothetical protein [Thiomicrospira microaerophila]
MTKTKLIEYKKDWLSFEDQLTKLTSRGLIATEPNKAIETLKRIGYYRLSGYFYSLKQRCGACCFIDDPDNIKVRKGVKQVEKVVKNDRTTEKTKNGRCTVI